MTARERQAASEGKDRVSVWERLERPAPTPRTVLAPLRIARTAVAVADAEGLDAVTMRRLATELGVAPMAAYRYVTGKDELLELMVDFVYAELELPDGKDDWRTSLRSVALRIREVLLRHSWVTRATWCAPTPNQLAVTEAGLAALDGLGLDADDTMAVYNTLMSYVHGAVDSEIGLTQMLRVRGWSNREEARAGLASQMAWLMTTGRYPMYARYITEAERKDDPQWQFEAGLDAVLDGIAARLAI
ncbi:MULTISPECIES: TetR/AcrR family transcriptional regulator [unclassified Streptomyces]|uniref:TetR/AcrR family transcriptional regulator n=1 Tax=unclassified Streptomyces TaxID=2593676 RepID=UPI000DB9ED0C|nr:MULTISPECIES: TetR/AcrR family transcriptional regulator [unclassified Streptomyces]MYT74285.1 TetR family transcriptional regulator [Streptomyces sp. SID8367]RAJ91261.1 TetR family transcriptional regulator [Streptomyces sp. PsTaAH-137]